MEQEEALGRKLLILAAENAATNPSPDHEWRTRIAAVEENFEREKSIALRREHIAWKRRNDLYLALWKSLTDLSRLLWICGQGTEATSIVAIGRDELLMACMVLNSEMDRVSASAQMTTWQHL